ncbi:MAG: pantetheine-phosphate adenylyltransferase [Alistipes sp.]|nr:pantetheine-phosphate adenylyltransferase [Alistipes sp.]
MKRAIFPGSFDPFTRGHQALVQEALTLFDEVIIAIGENVSKQHLLPLESRIEMIRDIYNDNNRIKCMSYSTLTGDFALSVGAQAIVRGVRNTIDFEYERTMAQTNKRLYPSLTTVILLTPPELADVSSSTVRELLKFGQEVSNFLPEGVELEKYTK